MQFSLQTTSMMQSQIQSSNSKRRKQMADLFKNIVAFHEKFGLSPVADVPAPLDDHVANFRANFMDEELAEYLVAVASDDGEGQLDALVDLVYVALGTAYLQGFNFNEAWNRVHTANMSKVRAKSADESKRGSSFDVVKPDGWVAPNLKDLAW
jgi:predicted HAD superfamily Cof-like phosphohydrolase